MPTKTIEQVNQELTTQISTVRPDISVASGSVNKDVFIDPNSTAVGLAYLELDGIRGSFSEENVASLYDSQVEDLARNFFLVRKPATPSTGVVVFFKNSEPSAPITIPAGTNVSTETTDTSTAYSFITQVAVILDNTMFNSETNRYETRATPIVCTSNGVETNVASRTITTQSASDIDGVVNILPTTGGGEIESNVDLAARTTIAKQARALGTKPGYQTLVGAIENIRDSNVVTAGDFEIALRNTYGNEVDITIISTTRGNATAEFTAALNPETGILLMEYILPRALQPTFSILKVTNLTKAREITNYTFIEDVTSAFKFTVQARNAILFNDPADIDDGDRFEVIAEVNTKVQEVQAVIESPENAVINANVLAREGIAFICDIGLNARVYAYKDRDDAKNEIITELGRFVGNLKLGEPLEASDVLLYLRNRLDFIDNITEFNTFQVRGTPKPIDQLPNLYCNAFEYFSADNDSFKNVMVS